MLNLSSLNPQQRVAVETIHGPVLILAGAGTGKTRVITFRIAHMIARGIPPEKILAVTFTNKAAREMQERVRKLLPRPVKSTGANAESKESGRPTLCTFHSLCVRILRQHIDKLGYKRNFVIYDESEQLGTIKKILADIHARGEKTEPWAILSELSRLKNGAKRSGGLGDPGVIGLAAHVRPRYESMLRACNAVDFDDLILLTLRLFQEHPDALTDCRQRFQYVMVDEYQDTNSAQFRLVHALTAEHKNLCVVGDDDQSIYGWRGAEIANLLDMEKHFPGVKVIKLEQNYRSTTNILNAANAVIKHNVLRRGKQLWSSNGAGGKISLHTFKDEEEEARSIVEQIEYARGLGQPWKDQAILFRTNAQSRPLETALRKGGVRYRLIGGQSFFDRREIRDFLAYLKVFLNPNDDISLLRIANTPARGLSDTTMERLLGASHERKCSVFAVMRNPVVAAGFQSRTQESIATFVKFVERTAAQLQPQASDIGALSLRRWAEHFMEEIRYWTEMRRLEKTPEAAEGRIRNLKELIGTLDDTSAEAANGAPLSEKLQLFLEEITLESDREDEKEDHGDSVTLITMHSCKGLEFPKVYIVGMEHGLLPHSRSVDEGTLDEERRLFYVAITRAMKSLTISHCASRKKYGELKTCQPSSFLADLPLELVEHASEAAKRPVAPDAGKSMFSAMRAIVGD